MSRTRHVGAALLAWLADRADGRRGSSSITRPRYWLHRLLGSRLRATAARLEGDR